MILHIFAFDIKEKFNYAYYFYKRLIMRGHFITEKTKHAYIYELCVMRLNTLIT